MTYFDWNATAPLHEAARKRFLEATEDAWANPSTPYRRGVQSRLALDEARCELAALAGVGPEAVIFTSGATEANNGMLREGARRSGGQDEIWISAVEHPSVSEAASFFWGADRVRCLPVGATGVLDLNRFQEWLRKGRPGMVSVMAANNETGVLQPWREVQQLCGEEGIPFHCDAVQWFGKEDGQVCWEGLAGVTLSGHKFGGPKGVGALLVGPEWKGLTLQAGGAQELDSRAGTENIPAVLAMVAALKARLTPPPGGHRRAARDRFERALLERWPGEVAIHGHGSERLWNTSSVCLPEFRSERWILQLDRSGFEVSSGSACSTGKAGPSAVLRAMGVSDEAIRRTIRISSGWETEAGDWDGLLEALVTVRERLSGEAPSAGPGTVIEI